MNVPCWNFFCEIIDREKGTTLIFKPKPSPGQWVERGLSLSLCESVINLKVIGWLLLYISSRWIDRSKVTIPFPWISALLELYLCRHNESRLHSQTCVDCEKQRNMCISSWDSCWTLWRVAGLPDGRLGCCTSHISSVLNNKIPWQ